MKRYLNIIIVSAICWLFISGPTVLASQVNFVNPQKRHINIPVDYTLFKSEQAGKVRLEIYYQTFNRMFSFVEKGDNFEAKFELQLVINDKKGNQAGYKRRSKSFLVPSKADTRSGFSYRTNQANFDLAPGKYKVILSLSDLNSNTVLTSKFDVKLKEFKVKKNPSLSGVEFINTAGRKGERASVFDKGNYTIVPSVGHQFGGENDPRLLFYVEMYPGKKEREQVVMETVLRSRVKGMVYRDTIYTPLDQPVIRQIRDISLDGMAAGEYELELTLRGNKNKKLAHVSRTYRVKWSLKGQLRNDFKKAIRQLEYIANGKELDSLKKLNDYEQRLVAFDRFWAKRDPSPETGENEAKREFYRRVAVANDLFSYIHREGWITDRGRIYIMYGEPDQLDDYPIVHNERPYQIWHYYKAGRYRRFAFVDIHEDGDYQLQFPYDGLGQRPDF